MRQKRVGGEEGDGTAHTGKGRQRTVHAPRNGGSKEVPRQSKVGARRPGCSAPGNSGSHLMSCHKATERVLAGPEAEGRGSSGPSGNFSDASQQTGRLCNGLHNARTAGGGTAFIQGWSEEEKGPGPWKPSQRDTRGGFRLASAHTGGAEWGPGWQLSYVPRKGRESNN